MLKAGEPDARAYLQNQFSEHPELPFGDRETEIARDFTVTAAVKRLHKLARAGGQKGKRAVAEYRKITAVQMVQDYWTRMTIEAQLKSEVKLRNQHNTLKAGQGLAYLRHEAHKLTASLPLFADVVREMEARFGSSVTVAFIFMQWLISLNVKLVLIWVGMVIIPWFYSMNGEVFWDFVCGTRVGARPCFMVAKQRLRNPTDMCIYSKEITTSGLSKNGELFISRKNAALMSGEEYVCGFTAINGNSIARFLEATPMYVNGFDEDVSGTPRYSFIYLLAIVLTNIFSGVSIVRSIGKALSGKADTKV